MKDPESAESKEKSNLRFFDFFLFSIFIFRKGNFPRWNFPDGTFLGGIFLGGNNRYFPHKFSGFVQYC